MKLLRRVRALWLLAALALAAPASATWSVVLVDRSTGEVAVGSATCLFVNLRQFVPVVVVGKGAAAAQSLIDAGATNRMIIFDALEAGATPEEILEELINGSGTLPAQRQYGIAALDGAPVTFTGGAAAIAKGGVSGQVGSIAYAIQGNLLANDGVVPFAERALLATKGDLGQKLLAAMQAAASAGGDGRCSCAPDPAPCGEVTGFQKSAHAGFMLVARVGDVGGPCTSSGCAQGNFYMALNVKGVAGPPDPVRELSRRYEIWRGNRIGRPDGVRSVARVSADRLPADGESLLSLRLRLVDVDGVPIEHGGATIEVAPADPSAPPLYTVGPVIDHEDGSYEVALRAGTTIGSGELLVTADDGVEKATFYPLPRVELVEPQELVAGRSSLGAADEGVPFVLSRPVSPGAFFVVLGSASGTRPGLELVGATLPLNDDAWFRHTLASAVPGRLDAAGRAEWTWRAAPALRRLLAGRTLSWAALTFDGTLHASEATSFLVEP